MNDFNPSLLVNFYKFGWMSVVVEGLERREIFSRCHNSTQGHHGIQ